MSRTTAVKWTGVTYPCELEGDDAAEALGLAQDVLFSLSGGRVGQFVTVEDAYWVSGSRSDCGVPYKDADGEWRNGGTSVHDCCTIELFRHPVQSVQQVRIGGEVVDASEYELLGNTLMRVGACWPVDAGCEVPLIQVDYTWGVRPGMVAKAAAGELACEMSAALTPGQTCSLPSAWTDIVRQGVTVKRPNVTELVKAGYTGLPLTDQFIRVYNPRGLTQRSRVVHVDGPSRAAL